MENFDFGNELVILSPAPRYLVIPHPKQNWKIELLTENSDFRFELLFRTHRETQPCSISFHSILVAGYFLKNCKPLELILWSH